MNINEILADRQQTLGDNVPSKATVCHWVAQFKRCDIDLEDDNVPDH